MCSLNAYDADRSAFRDDPPRPTETGVGDAPEGVDGIVGDGERSARPKSVPIASALQGASAMGVVVGLLVLISQVFSAAFLITSLASSAATVIGTSGTAPTRPSAILFGHISSALCGLAIAGLMPPGPLAYGIAVGVASGVMLASRRLHPPAAANAIISFIYRDTIVAYMLAIIAIAVTLALLSAILRARPSIQR